MRFRQEWTMVCLGSLLLSGCRAGVASAQEKRDEPDARMIELTVYNDDFAMVREQRPVTLRPGPQTLRVTDVSRKLDPSSVMFAWDKPEVQVVASTYDLGISDSSGLLQRYLGQPVEMVWTGEDGREGKRVKGTLEASMHDGLVLRTEDEFLVDPKGTIIAPVRKDVVTLPQLTASLESQSAGGAKMDLTYLTRGLSWSADYVATLEPDADRMRLECWATVTNQTSASFPNAKISLVAGSPNRKTRSFDFNASPLPAMAGYKMPVTEESMIFNKVEAPSTTGELYSYRVKSQATISPGQMNRVRMMYSPKVEVKRVYTLRLESGGFDYGNAHTQRRNAQLALHFANRETVGLGTPLPSGSVRVYEPGMDGAAHYVGAAAISNTPKGGSVSLTLSDVFDVTGEHRLVKVTRLNRKSVRRDYTATLKNAKKKPVDLRVVQTLYGEWKVVSESSKSTRPDATTAQWTVKLPAQGEAKMSYSIVQPW